MKRITNSYIKKYNLQLEAITLMFNYKRIYGLSISDKKLLKSIQRYFIKIQNQQIDQLKIGDVVINDKNIQYYRKKFVI